MAQASKYKKTRQWLIYLADQLEIDSQTEFLIENMQPIWLNEKQLKWYQTCIFFLLALIYGPLLMFLFILLIDWKTLHLKITGVMYLSLINIGISLTVWLFLIFIASGKILPVERPLKQLLQFWKTVREETESYCNYFFSFLTFLLFLPLFLMYLPLVQYFKDQDADDLEDAGDLNIKLISNQGIRKSAKNFGCFLFFATSFGFLISLPSGFIRGLIGGLFFGYLTSILIGMGFGGKAYIQHITLRFILYYNKLIPWNYDRFLDYCTERLLLQRVGGGYRFMHKSLQEHFANMGE